MISFDAEVPLQRRVQLVFVPKKIRPTCQELLRVRLAHPESDFLKLLSLAMVKGNPQKVTAFGDPEAPRETILTVDEVKALFLALKEDHDVGGATLVQLLAHTGARRGEGLRARWNEFDLELGEWTVPSDHIKGGRRHGITIRRPLSSVATQLMRDWRAGRKHESELVFPQTGNPSDRRYDVKAVWERVRLKAGLPNLRLHDLRHNFASMALMNGATLYEIGAVLGHRDAQTTARYAHLSNNQRSRVADLVGKSISDAMKG